MRLIGTLPTDTDATRFSDYLLSIGMPAQVEAGRDGSWQVWIEHDDHIEQATSQLHAYLANPNESKYREAMSAAIRMRKDATAKAERRQRKHIDVRTSWSGVKVGPTPVAFLLIAICLLVGVLTSFSMDSEAAQPARVVNALMFFSSESVQTELLNSIGHGHVPSLTRVMFSAIAQGQVWRLVTPIFLHGDLLHLGFNMLWLITLGRMIEARKGSLFLAALVVGSAILSNASQAYWDCVGPGAGLNGFGGFSGVNYALFGYAWIKGRFQPYEHVGVGPQTVGLMLTWLVLCIVGVIPHVANAAHVVGLAAGVAVGYAPVWLRRIKTRS